MFIKRYLHDIHIAVEAIVANRVKSILTALGIIFGVAAVISMLAIGNGAEQEILEQIKLVGVNNIVITPSSFTVNWSGQDDQGGSGIFTYDVYVSDNGGVFTLLLDDTTLPEPLPPISLRRMSRRGRR